MDGAPGRRCFPGRWLARRASQSSRLIVLAFGLGLATLAQAFTDPGYKAVIQLAQFHLTDETKAALAQLYNPQWDRELIQHSDWADIIRPSVQLRTVLFTREDSAFDAARHCPKNACVVGAIMESRYVLTHEGFSDEQRRQAVQFMMHFITDLHIPVNAGLREDYGGRRIRLETSELDPVNLSEIWNDKLYPRLPGSWFDQAQRFQRALTPAQMEAWTATLSPVDWAWETHRIALEQAYPMAERRQYDAGFVREALPLLEQQMMKAGIRLAALLNDIFKPETEGAPEEE